MAIQTLLLQRLDRETLRKVGHGEGETVAETGTRHGGQRLRQDKMRRGRSNIRHDGRQRHANVKVYTRLVIPRLHGSYQRAEANEDG